MRGYLPKFMLTDFEKSNIKDYLLQFELAALPEARRHILENLLTYIELLITRYENKG